MVNNNIPVVRLMGAIEESGNHVNDEAVVVAAATQLLDAFTTIGFATLIDHGVDASVIEQAFAASHAFFALSTESKLECKFQGYKSNRGYIPFGLEVHDKNNDAQMPDMKETFDIGPEKRNIDDDHNDNDDEFVNHWPKELANESFRQPLLEYFANMGALHLRILKLLGIALKLPNPNYFVERCNQQHENLRLLHYPSFVHTDDIHENDQDDTSKTCLKQLEPIVRGRLHTDFGTITLVCQDSVGGLRAQRLDGSWCTVPPVPNSIVVNVGDMLQRWTNHWLRATPHQVVEILPSADSDDVDNNDVAVKRNNKPRIITDRYSIAFFCNANKDTIIDCLPECVSQDRPALYPAINAHDYLIMRLEQTISTKAASL